MMQNHDRGNNAPGKHGGASRIIKLCISIWYHAGSRTLNRTVTGADKRYVPSLTTIYYHSVREFEKVKFARQMDMLQKHTKAFCLLDDTPEPYGSCNVAVTFDDGFVSVMENALPELEARGITSVMFIPTGFLGASPGWLMGNSETDSDQTIMDEHMIRTFCSRNFAAGSHCVSHTDLTLLGDDRALDELTRSKKTLEEITCGDIDMVSFPHGRYDSRIVRLAKTAGYKRAFSVLPVLSQDIRKDFVIGRIPVSPHDWRGEFYLKIMGAYQWLPLGSVLKRKLRKKNP